MKTIVKRLSLEVPVPLIIDTTEVAVAKAALQTAPGRCLINSTNLESGEEKAGKIFSLAKQYSAAVMCLTIDEQGMAKTAARKLEIARRMSEIAINEYHLRPEDLIFDPLTFTLATGEDIWRDSAIETLKASKIIKENLPGVHTCLGISNVSFGLSGGSQADQQRFPLSRDRKRAGHGDREPCPHPPLCRNIRGRTGAGRRLIFNRAPDALEKLLNWFESHEQ